MTERRRGLGRGLGSLIPSQETGRPSDVFFTRGEQDGGEQSAEGGAEDKATARKTSDPAESMRRAQAGRKPGSAKRTSSGQSKGKAATNAGKKVGGASKRSSSSAEAASAESRAGASKATAAKSAAPSGSGTQAVTSSDSSPSSMVDADADVAGTGPSTAETSGRESSVSRETESAEDLVPVPGTTYGELSLGLIRPNPRQPRDVFDEDALEELVTSIREIGVLQPVVVRRRLDDASKYELIMGERRYRASKDAGLETIPAIVRETSDDDLLRDALLENLHRVDLNPLEEAAAYAQLLEDFSCTQEELSERIGRSRPQISNTLRLLRLPPMVQRRVAAGVLSSGHARAILGLNDAAQMEVLAQRVVAEGLSVRATEEAVVLLNRGERISVSRGTREPDPALAELARNIGDRLETRVKVTMGKKKGRLSVEFANQDDLKRILTLLGIDNKPD